MEETKYTKIIDNLVEAYNSSDARAFADLFDETAIVYEHPQQPTQQSREEIFEYYKNLFGEFPENRTEVLHRTVLGNRIIDHERVRRSFAAEAFEVVTIYQMGEKLIKRVDFIRS